MPKKPKNKGKCGSHRTTAYDVQILPAKPNPMFSEYQTAITKFLCYTQPVRCAYCGHLKRTLWTQLVFFRIAEGFEKKIRGKVVPSNSFVATKGKELFPPLTPVCGKHILAPQI